MFKLPRAHCVVPSADGRFFYIASHGTDSIRQYELDRTHGRLVEIGPPGFASAKGAGPRHIEIHAPTGRMYVVNEQNGSVDMLRVDPASGRLTHLASATMLPAGYDAVSTAADIHITRNGRFLYASERTKSFLVSYAVDAQRDRLDVIEWIDTEESPRGFAIDPSDRFLLCTGQMSGGLSVYAIDQATGRLRKTDSVPLGPNANWIDVIELP
jgi:6-phosphogluconolactonase